MGLKSIMWWARDVSYCSGGNHIAVYKCTHQHVVHIKLTNCYMSIISQFQKREKSIGNKNSVGKCR